ncbi:MAG: hypothetical protein AAFW60_09940 [Pseudomonadota bacterium]
MKQQIDLKTAAARRWDVVIAGSSFAAMFFAQRVKGRGLNVLFVEKGPFIDTETQLATRHTDKPFVTPQKNTSGARKDWAVRHQFGGCSNCWWGNTPRFHPHDLRLKTLYGVAEDWPLSFDTLEPYISEAEEIMEIAGDSQTDFIPRSRPYRYPSHNSSLSILH